VSKGLSWLHPKTSGVDATALAVLRRGVERVDARLLHACAFPAPYWPAFAHAWAFVQERVAALPHPLLIKHDAFLSQPLVRALFATPDEIADILCRSPEAREYAAQHGGGCHALHALLTAQYTVHDDFGVVEREGVLLHDQPRQAWSFDHHALFCPMDSELEVRAALALRFMEGLFTVIAARFAQHRLGLAEAAVSEVGDLCRRIEDFEAVLWTPGDYFSMQRRTVSLDATGVVCGTATREGRTLDLIELHQFQQPIRVITLVQCQRDGKPPSLSQGLDEASRWLG